MIEHEPPLRLAVEACFTITVRGTVVSGEVTQGVARIGDELDLVRDGVTTRIVCEGVEDIYAKDRATRSTGILVRDLPRFDPGPDDFIAAPQSW